MMDMLAYFRGQEGTVPEMFLDVLLISFGFSNGTNVQSGPGFHPCSVRLGISHKEAISCE